MKTVQIRHPSGCPVPFPENILTLLYVRKNDPQQFKIGEWLSILGEDMLCNLAKSTELRKRECATRMHFQIPS